jgi:DNA-binding transcriptional regulator YhcF (GntR family)
MSLISVKENIGIPLYKQIVLSIENALLEGIIKKNDKLPSINSIRNRFSLSRDTVLLAYNELKARGIVQSIAGKGYYVKSENINIKQKILLLFDELNAFKEDLYNSFLATLEKNIEVDIFFHHFNPDVFSKLIYDNLGSYNYYIIMPANLKNTNIVIDNLPEDKVYILDQTHEELSKYSSIYQNFEKDIYDGLFQGLDLLKKYKKLVFIFLEKKQPQGLLKGFEIFCKEFSIKNEVVSDIESRELSPGEVYLIPDDKNLILVIKKMKEKKLLISNDIGIISYNETLLKEIVEGGITTISTDFKKMGERLAQMVTNKEKGKIENISKFILRNSI